MVKKSISKILSVVLASAMVVTSLAVTSVASPKPTDWAMGIDTSANADEMITSYTVSAARLNPTFNVPVKIFNNTNTENYTVYVNYNPEQLMLVNATQGDFSLSTEDLMSKSVNHKPAVGNEFFSNVNPDGVKTEAELGKVKFAYSATVAGTAALTASEATAFTLQFQVKAANPQANDKYWINLTTDNGGSVLYQDDAKTNSDKVSNGFVLITANPGSSTGGGGGGGGVRPATTTTEATTETATSSVVTPEPGDNDGKNVSLNKDDHFAYVVGYPEGTVRPNGQITRAEVASIYFRLLTEGDRAKFYTNANNFDDVMENLWYNIAVSSMTKAGIVHGYTDGSFQGNKPITRAEFATIAAQFDNGSYAGEDKFGDINGHWAAKYINAAAELGWIHGYEDGTFKPNQNITRAEAMTLINSMLDRQVSVDGLLDDMNKWSDNMNQDAWYYTIVQEATNSHFYNRPDGTVEDWSAMREAPDWASIERPGSVYKELVGISAVEPTVVESTEAVSEESTESVEEASEETTETVETTTEEVTAE